MNQNDNLSPTSAYYDPVVIRERFVGAMRQTLTNLSADDAAHVRRKLIEILGEWNPSVLASPDMLAQASDFIFTDEPLRDWIFTTKFVFFMNIAAGGGHAVIRSILSDLALAASEDMEAILLLNKEEQAASGDAVAMPEQLVQDLPTASQTRTVLASNTWLIVLLMLFSFVDLEHEVLKTPVPPGPTKSQKQ
jgi:hypothetical protein